MNGASDQLVIRTPEGCTFAMPLAGPVSRFLAWLVDLVIVMALTIALTTALVALAVVGGLMLAAAFHTLAMFVVWIGYGVLCEQLLRGRTIGKRALRLQVVDATGLHLTFSQVLVRNLLRFVDMLPLLYLVGGVSMLLSRRAQRLGDLAAGTVVVYTPPLGEVKLPPSAGAGKFNSLRSAAHLCARLRQRTSPAEGQIVLQALLRREGLEPQARVELFAAVAEHFKQIVEFPQHATEGLSDEQYVRNLAEILFTPARPGRQKQPSA